MTPPLSAWPAVLGELETMRRVAAGASIARFGDGEFKIIYGSGYVREPPNLKLGTELFEVLSREQPGLLVGIPTMDPAGPKIASWRRHHDRFLRILPEREYVSAFVTRPDSAPWTETVEYLEAVEAVWRGRRAVIVCSTGNKILQAVRQTAARTWHVACPYERSYAVIGRLEREVLALAPDVAVLSVGPTATCLAARLARAGVQAVDFGSAGGFIARLRALRERIARGCPPADPEYRGPSQSEDDA